MKLTFLQRHAYGIGCGAAVVLWWILPKRRRLSVDNVLKAKITDDVKEAKRIAKRAWCHLAGHIGEALFVPGVVTKENYREHLDFSEADSEAVRLLLDRPDIPIIIASGHHGVWEAATNVISFARPMMAIARTLNNKFLARWMKKHHFRGPVTIINKKRGFTPDVMRQWTETRSAMTILMDQHASKGAPLEFLGRPAKTFTSVARLAIRNQCPVVVGSFVRRGPYLYGLVGGAPLTFPKGTDPKEATQILNDRLGEAIRKYPEQYLWAHRRWR